MLNRRSILAAAPLALAPLVGAAPSPLSAQTPPAKAGTRGVMLMNRIGPSSSELFIADADGGNERKFLAQSAFEYHASWARDGRSVVFTSERNGDGQSDIYRARADGTEIQPLVVGPSVDDAGALSPDGAQLAFVSTRDSYRANIWLLDLKTKRLRNLTAAVAAQADGQSPDCYFRPAWSPDGRWIAFSSDRNTTWRGHDDGRGWEHTQELSIYVIRPDGSGFRQVATKPTFCLGSPTWSADSKRIAFYEIPTENTWGAHRPEGAGRIAGQIVSVDVESGARIEHTKGPGVKVAPHFIGADVVYLVKGGADQGLASSVAGASVVKRAVRSPAWSPDGSKVICEKMGYQPVRPLMKPLYSWDPQWDYRHIDVFPTLSRQGKLLFTDKQTGDSSLIVMNPDGSDRRNIFDPKDHGYTAQQLGRGSVGAFQPTWSPDGQWVAFGVGSWLVARATGTAMIMRVRSDGTGLEALTDGVGNAGFPSYSADGKQLVYRVWGAQDKGLRIIDIATKQSRVLTSEYDNTPGWSPDGQRIVFTRKTSATNFDVFTIRPDGTDLKRLTDSGANDAHAVWTADGRIAFNTGMYGFRDEAALYDETFQPYGQIMIMNADGSGKRLLTDSLWEDSMPLYVPRRA